MHGILIVDVMLLTVEVLVGGTVWWGIKGANKRHLAQITRRSEDQK